MVGKETRMDLSPIAAICYVCYIFLSAANIAGRYRNSDRIHFITKPLLMPMLALFYVSALGQNSSPLVLLALGFGTAGDVLLLVPRSKGMRWFLIGMGSFMAGHICYFRWFIIRSAPIGWELPWLVGTAAAIFLTVWFRHTMSASGHRYAPVLSAYSLVIDLIIVGSLTTWGRGPMMGTLLCFTGTLFFCLSDFFIAMNMIGQRIGDEGSVMITYTTAQLLIVSGITILS